MSTTVFQPGFWLLRLGGDLNPPRHSATWLKPPGFKTVNGWVWRVVINRTSRIVVALTLIGASGVICLLVFGKGLDVYQVLRQRRVRALPSTITVKAGGNVQRAIDNARFGDTIILEAGATYVGPLVLPYKESEQDKPNDYITIQTSNVAGIPREGERVKPDQHARAMPKIISPDKQVAVGTAARAHHYRFIGIEFAPAANAAYVYSLVDLGDSSFTSTAQFPHHLIFDRCYVHSTGLNKARRGFALNSAETSIFGSHISGFAGAGDETQAIAGWNGPGPFHIVNNYLEGGGQGLMFGGGDPSVPGLIPSDIEIRKNHFYKPAEWFGRATIKASLELKSARRVVIDGNLIESGGYVGAFVITVRNQDGKATWSTIEDVEITNNLVRHAGGGITILGRDDIHASQEGKRLRVANNLFTDFGPDETAMFLKISGGQFVTIENNTVEQRGNIITSWATTTRDFIFRNNILPHNSYGIFCENGPSPLACFPAGIFAGNAIIDNKNLAASGYPISRKFPSRNFFPRSFEEVRFMDYRRGDWRLAKDSPYKGKATNGGDPGVNVDLLNAAQAKPN